MSWFKVDASVTDFDIAPLPITRPIVDAAGKPVEGQERPVAQHEIRKGVDVRSLGQVYLDVNPRIPIGDCLAYTFRMKLILSEATLKRIDDAGCVLHEDIYLLPLIARNSVTKSERGRYTILWPLRQPPVLDLEKSDVEFYRGGLAIRKVKRWVFRSDVHLNVDLFQCESDDWLASERFYEAVTSAGLKGFEFTSIEG